MDRSRALAVLAEKMDEGPLSRLAEEIKAACDATEAERQRDVYVDGSLRARAGRIRAAKVGLKRRS